MDATEARRLTEEARHVPQVLADTLEKIKQAAQQGKSSIRLPTEVPHVVFTKLEELNYRVTRPNHISW